MANISRLLTTNKDWFRSLKNAALLLTETSTAPEAGKGIAFAPMGLEAVLLEESNSGSIVARLKEAVAYRLARTDDERSQFRKRIGKLYDCRSQFVHNGFTESSEPERYEATDITCQVLRKAIDEID